MKLFNNSSVQAFLNTNFQVQVAGQTYNALHSALGVTSSGQVGQAIQATYTFCTRVSTNRTQIEFTHAGVRRRANAWSSFYPFGPVQILTVKYSNEVRSGSRWRNERANLQVGTTGQLRVPVVCATFQNNTFNRGTPLKNRGSIEMRTVLTPDIWKARDEFQNRLAVTGVPYARTFVYNW